MLRGMRRAAQPALAGLLAVAVLVITTLSVCPSLHRVLHEAAGATTTGCVVCLFAHGQVHAVDTVVVQATQVVRRPGSVRLPRTAVVGRSDCRLSPSRAPPRG